MPTLSSLAQRSFEAFTLVFAVFLLIDLSLMHSSSKSSTALLLSSLVYSLSPTWLRDSASHTAAATSQPLIRTGRDRSNKEFKKRLAGAIDLLFAIAYSFMASLLYLHFSDSPATKADAGMKIAGIVISIIQVLLYAAYAVYWLAPELLGHILGLFFRCSYCEGTNGYGRRSDDLERAALKPSGERETQAAEGETELETGAPTN